MEISPYVYRYEKRMVYILGISYSKCIIIIIVFVFFFFVYSYIFAALTLEKSTSRPNKFLAGLEDCRQAIMF